MAMVPYSYTSKSIAKRWRSKSVSTSMGFEFTGILFSFFRYFFGCQIYWFTLVLTFDFCYSQLIFFVYMLFKKDAKIKKTMKYSEKNKFIKERWRGPTFKF